MVRIRSQKSRDIIPLGLGSHDGREGFLVRNYSERDYFIYLGRGMQGMTLPTIDQTEGIWIARTNNQGHHSIQEVFSGKTEIERTHRANCRLLLQRGSLEPEHPDHLLPSQRVLIETERYSREHI